MAHLIRTALRISRPAFTAPTPRFLSSTSLLRGFNDFSRPGPPPLPAAEQAEFEELIKKAEVAPTVGDMSDEELLQLAQSTEHRDLRRGAAPEFEGDVNPKTGEVGGPKRDPFIAGNADWQFGGRVTVSA